MDIQPQTAQPTKPISDDQELAKVLAGVTKDTNDNLGFEETPVVGATTPAVPTPPMPAAPAPTDAAAPEPLIQPKMPAMPSFNFDESMIPGMAAPAMANNNLDGIRKDALMELRPLVDKLDLAPEEKFDIYLLLLRSTDDTALIAPAHEAAKNIADESKRAEALLDVIKEIDFLSTNPPSASAPAA